MTCIHMNGAIVCGFHPRGQLKLGNRYITVEMHPYCGPSFWYGRNENKPYDPKDENDPIWPIFDAWLKKHNAAQAKLKARAAGVAPLPQAKEGV